MMRLMTKEDRQQYRAAIVPKGAVKVVPKDVAAEFYLYENSGRPSAMCFIGTSGKPSWRYWFPSVEARAKRIAQQIESLKVRAKGKAEQAKSASQPHSFEVGHHLVTCWGYEQTNREFFRVIEVKGPRTIVVQEVETIDTSPANSAWATGSKVPGENFAKGSKPLTLRTSYGNSVKPEGHHASLWDGKPASWTAYH